MTEARPPRVRCYSLRAHDGAASLCHALSVFVAVRGNPAVHDALRMFKVEPREIAILPSEGLTSILTATERTLQRYLEIADFRYQLVDFCRRAVWQRWFAGVDDASSAVPAPAATDGYQWTESEFFQFYGDARAEARQQRNRYARILEELARVLNREWRRPFANMIANDNPAAPKASGAGE